MEQVDKVSMIAGGFLASAWQEGRKVMGFGPTEEAALTDLRRNLTMIDQIRARPFSDGVWPKAQ